MTVSRTIHVSGVGQTGPVVADTRSIPEMVLDAVDAALADAGIGHDGIDAVTTASVDLFDGITASNIAITEVVGAVMKPETRISADGLAALAHAACQVWSGAYDTVLVVAHAKASMAPYEELTRWAMDPVYVQPLDVDFLTCAGLQAALLASGDRGAEQRWAEIAATRRHQAAAPLDAVTTPRAVLSSPYVAVPLRQGMCTSLGDGACAVVLSTATDGYRPILSGIGYDLEPHALGDRDLTHWPGFVRAFDRAAKIAGLRPHDTKFDLAEPSCFFAHEEDLFSAAAGLGEDVDISPSGGLLAGCVPVVAGLSRLAAAVSRLGEPEGHRHRALAHGTWGPAAQGQVVALLEGASA